MKIWKSPAGILKLKRFPFAGDASHQAWDAADEWIINRFADYPAVKTRPTAIVGEAFGVLGTALGGGKITALSDSLMSLLSLEENRKLNPSADGPLTVIKADTDFNSPDKAKFEMADKLIIRLPKNLELLEVYIRLSLSLADENTEIWLGGMDKRWNRGVQKITDRYLETAERFPFVRHARWIKYRIKAESEKPASSFKSGEWELERYPVAILPAPAVFASAVMDAGTAAFIEKFPEAEAEAAEVIVDLGCGSGILGLSAAYLNPEGRVIFTDESSLAVANAEANFRNNEFTAAADFLQTNGADGIADASVDLVLCNPPFHYQNIQTREPAEFLFGEARRILKPGGTVQIVGNSHLGYHKLLKDYFIKARDVYRDSKFTVMRGKR
ncbi:MAG TPA: hypothetical protein DCO79_04075 [Spirochaeta sp.]|nr:hypothetical protein [Spirochaeta sp.]